MKQSHAMTDLIARLEAAPEGSRELSDECLLAVGWRVERPEDCGTRDQTGDCYGCGSKPPGGDKCAVPRSGWKWISPARVPLYGKRPDPSRNVQDVIDWMVPEGCGWSISDDGEGLIYKREKTEGQAGYPVIGECAGDTTPALALSAAGLRAHEYMKVRAALSARESD